MVIEAAEVDLVLEEADSVDAVETEVGAAVLEIVEDIVMTEVAASSDHTMVPVHHRTRR
ncbi:hypothetical protein OESDEN_00581 [Oesophagostomum dentatum]|uniref:Uncharacterized protein n=1 Tax=Oesophagostomum dentatum TaxID=61180 RepID=A0A0B1TPF3_OESDE|nr:hypothetical protein OESDEN_00581 [Oesophagostomum dentatum]